MDDPDEAFDTSAPYWDTAYPYWDTACLDWEDRLLRRQSLVPTLPILGAFREEADKAARIFRRLRMPDVPGRPSMGEAAGPWLFPLIEAIFGSLDIEANARMIQEFFLLIPKKNGKTSYAAAIMIVAMIVNRRPEAEFMLIATTKEVASRAFRQAFGIIRADPELQKLFQIQQHIKTITHRVTGALLKVVAADTDVVTGGKQVGTLIDEMHVLGAKPNAADIMVEIRGAFAARPDGFLITITTQSKQEPAGVFKRELALARDVRDGIVKAPVLPILYEYPSDLAKAGAWKDPRYWDIVNPNFNRSVNPRFLQNELEKAKRDGHAQLALIASQHFNIEIGLGLRGEAWEGAKHWLAAAEPALTLEDLLARCEVVAAGGDGGGLDDLYALVILGRERDTRRWLVWAHAWCMRSVLTLRKEIAARLLDFESEGSLTIIDKPGADIEGIVAFILQAETAGVLADENAIGLDPFGVGALVDALAEKGIAEKRVVAISQGYKLQGAIKTAERKLADGTLRHDGSALMTWCVGNAKPETKGNATMITKAESGKAKIDPLMAMFNAVALMSMNPPAASGDSIYQKRGLLVL